MEMYLRRWMEGFLGWFLGMIFTLIGMINLFWGNDPGFGIFVLLLSLLFFPPVSQRINHFLKRGIPVLLKVIIAAFIAWASLGVGELCLKIGMMINQFSN